MPGLKPIPTFLGQSGRALPDKASGLIAFVRCLVRGLGKAVSPQRSEAKKTSREKPRPPTGVY